MAHNIEAIIAEAGVLRAFCALRPETVLVPLAHGLALVPATERLRLALDAPGPAAAAETVAGFELLRGGLARACSSSRGRAGRIVYVETRYFGGDGGQAAALNRAGRLQWADVKENGIGAISRALRALGVRCGTAYDEFDAAGLGNVRSTDELERAGQRDRGA